MRDDEVSSNPLNIDWNKVLTTYPEPKPEDQKYIPVPKGVLEQDAIKARGNGCELLPDYDDMLTTISKLTIPKYFGGRRGEYVQYLILEDDTEIERKKLTIEVAMPLKSEKLATAFKEAGFEVRANKHKAKKPIVTTIKTMEQYNKMMEVIGDVFNAIDD